LKNQIAMKKLRLNRQFRVKRKEDYQQLVIAKMKKIMLNLTKKKKKTRIMIVSIRV